MESSKAVSTPRRFLIGSTFALTVAVMVWFIVATHSGEGPTPTGYAAVAADVPSDELPVGGLAGVKRAADAVCRDLQQGAGQYQIPGYPAVTFTVGGVFVGSPGFGTEGSASTHDQAALATFAESAHRHLCPRDGAGATG